MEIKTLKLTRFEMDYFTFGSGEKTMVILPGMGLKSVMGSADEVAADYKIFDKEYTVYVFDRIKNMPDTYTVFDMAHDTAEAFDRLGLCGIYLFGMSQGGMMAQVIAARHPSLIEKAVLGSTHYRPSEVSDRVFSHWIELSREKDARKTAAGMIDLIYTKGFLERYRELILGLYENTTDEEFRRFGIMAKACLDFDFSDEIGNIRCPAFVIGAGDDKVMPGNESEETAKAVGCECYIYEGYAHAVCDEAPDYKERIFDFFED